MFFLTDLQKRRFFIQSLIFWLYILFQDFEWEIIDVELSGMSPDGSLGLELCGGRDEPCYPNDCSVYVTAVKKGSVADGRIK